MNDRPVEVARFDTLMNAQHFANRLAQAEIDCFIENKEAGSLYGSAGMGMIGIRVLVRSEDAERALGLLPQEPETDVLGEVFGGSEPWTCSACEASVPGDHELCWSCGADTDGKQNVDFERVEERLTESAAQAIEREQVTTPHVAQEERAGDESARRAFYAAVTCFWIPFFPFVSLVMALNLPPSETLTPTARRHARIALWVSVVFVITDLALLQAGWNLDWLY